MAQSPLETRYVETTRVACDGDEGALGHPRVFLQMDAAGEVTCPYCDRLFVLSGGPKDLQGSSMAPAAA
jgi:NADH dehydrogenase (ubiquinone) Fe-S protein 6